MSTEVVSGQPPGPGCLDRVWEAEEGYRALWTQGDEGSNPGSSTCWWVETAALSSVFGVVIFKRARLAQGLALSEIGDIGLCLLGSCLGLCHYEEVGTGGLKTEAT